MEMHITQTSEILHIEGVPFRRWMGVTPGGASCEVLVHQVLVPPEQDVAEFADLLPVTKPENVTEFADRLLLLYGLLSVGVPPAWQSRERELLGLILGGTPEQVQAADDLLVERGIMHIQRPDHDAN